VKEMKKSKSKSEVEVEVVEAKSDCKFADKDGYCCNIENQGGGFVCFKCEAYSPRTDLAEATNKAAAWLEKHEGDGEGVGGTQMPTTLTVRMHKHIVSVPVAQALSQQYERVSRVTNAALREMVVFGAMLERIDKALTSSRYTRSDNGPGVSLRSWLAENCPNIEYATAIDYKRTTRNYMAYMKLKEDTPLLEMMQADPYDDEQKEALRRRILDSMSRLTKTQLRRLTDERGKVGRPAGSGVTGQRTAKTEAEQAAAAAVAMREICGMLNAFIFEGTQCCLLTEEELDEFANHLKSCARKVHDIAAEG